MTNVARIYSVAPIGFEGAIVEVESHTTKGLPSLQIVGLGNKAIDEARERVKSAIINTLLEYPARKITINLAPAELPKDGTLYDLPIALSILTSSGQLNQESTANAVFAGELALNGDVRPVKGIISIVEAARNAGFSLIFLPEANVAQASLIPDVTIIGVPSLKKLYLHLKGETRLSEYKKPALPSSKTDEVGEPSLDSIYGQEQAKRALIIAAAGHHNILFSGPPGAGKTMLAKTLANLLPSLTHEEQIAVTKLHSLAGEATDSIIERRPFRSPHHTASRVALIGGGSKPKPGEISLAHLGVLFLDEVPEYPRSLLEALRQPLEDKKIKISRINGHTSYPADFMMIATMNPCPCGYFGDTAKECSCNSTQILSYQKRLSGPFIDRIDMTITVSRISNKELLTAKSNKKIQHKKALDVIDAARRRQANRFGTSTKYNSSLQNEDIAKYITITPEARDLLTKAADRLNLSARSYFKALKVAQTIADLEGASTIETAHVTEALQYRQNS